MATHTPIRHVYEVQNPERYKEVKHYLIVEVANGNRQLNEMVNISKDRKFSKAKDVDYWLKGKDTNQKKWSKAITGLKPTSTPMVYYGDIPVKQKGKIKPTNLLLFYFYENAKKLIIDVYNDFYTQNKEELQQLIKKGL